MRKIIACDFDGTLCDSVYPDLGEPIDEVIYKLKQEQQAGAILILWTCRVGVWLEQAIDWCKAHGVVFDYVNENCQQVLDEFGTESRKIFANEYWDDRAVLMNKNYNSIKES